MVPAQIQEAQDCSINIYNPVHSSPCPCTTLCLKPVTTTLPPEAYLTMNHLLHKECILMQPPFLP
jgi:hypothetical protein